MNREQISALMDGELDEARARALCAQIRNDETWECWASWHVIGDALRSECIAQRGFNKRFAERLAAEPTILSPGSAAGAPFRLSGFQGALSARRIQYAMAAGAMLAAVGLVGWFGVQEFRLGPGLNELASAAPARASTTTAPIVSVASRKAQVGISPYLLVHQEYSPTTAMQGVRPYVRTVADMSAGE